MDTQFPLGKLEVPTNATTDDVKQWAAQTNTYVTRLRKVVDHLTDEELAKTYRDGAWNIRQLVHHIADSQLNMYQRLKLALTDDTPTVPAFDQDAWATAPDTELSVESSIFLLDGINQRIVALAQTITQAQLQRTFIHAVNGEVTVATKLKKLAWHEEHHLAHIEIALQR
ncbi:MAG: putative metal-dependent hydrolase [Caryophanon sp.]|nr:putative metal-dependent hydrolase [Caryophanon sp.]